MVLLISEAESTTGRRFSAFFNTRPLFDTCGRNDKERLRFLSTTHIPATSQYRSKKKS